MAFRAKPQMDPLAREAREIERRRARLNERTRRVLHAKTRLIGVDTQALAQQVAEKQDRERLELERDFYHDSTAISHARAVSEQEAERQRQVKQNLAELNSFRKAQAEEKVRKSLLQESGAEALRDMETTFLTFQGEDLGFAARTRQQQLQQQDWLAQQIKELGDKEARERAETQEYEQMHERIAEIQLENEEAAKWNKRQEAEQVKEFNRAQAAAKAEKAARLAALEQAADDEELQGQLQSVFLNEGVPQGAGTEYFKGFSTSEHQAILDARNRQIEENKRRRQQEQKENESYDDQQERIRRAMILADRERQANKTQALSNLANERKVQAKEKTIRYDYLDQVVYPNEVTEPFFEQFGQSCR